MRRSRGCTFYFAVNAKITLITNNITFARTKLNLKVQNK